MGSRERQLGSFPWAYWVKLGISVAVNSSPPTRRKSVGSGGKQGQQTQRVKTWEVRLLRDVGALLPAAHIES